MRKPAYKVISMRKQDLLRCNLQPSNKSSPTCMHAPLALRTSNVVAIVICYSEFEGRFAIEKKTRRAEWPDHLAQASEGVAARFGHVH